jgi:hypothetical protein
MVGNVSIRDDTDLRGMVVMQPAPEAASAMTTQVTIPPIS